uniref:Uncharacterized protein n=1 Tax=Candidatus Kentrum sp. LFY TaxID=2126342 RepID=A0A450WHE5_9GAMM|nr:MAG: hypothetical protein BECKLFY1418C_GA0070996_102418 [Candidatus Kentron sp. LFY]
MSQASFEANFNLNPRSHGLSVRGEASPVILLSILARKVYENETDALYISWDANERHAAHPAPVFSVYPERLHAGHNRIALHNRHGIFGFLLQSGLSTSFVSRQLLWCTNYRWLMTVFPADGFYPWTKNGIGDMRSCWRFPGISLAFSTPLAPLPVCETSVDFRATRHFRGTIRQQQVHPGHAWWHVLPRICGDVCPAPKESSS